MNLESDCEVCELSDGNVIRDFDCGDNDLNDFFNRDAFDKFKHYVRFLTVDAYNKPEVLNFYGKTILNFSF